MATHICGQCNKQFTSEEEYLNHTCESTGFTPKDPDHLGPEFLAIQKAALARGEARKNPSEKAPVQEAPPAVEEPISPTPEPAQETVEEPERLVVEEIPDTQDSSEANPSEADILAAVRAARKAKKP